MIRWCLALLLLLTGCAPRKPEQLDTLYRDTQQQLRFGKLSDALAAAGRGVAAARRQSAPYWQWRFRLLEAKALITKGEAAKALALLAGGAPAGPQALELTARLRMEQGYAKLMLSEFHEARKVLDEAYHLATETGSLPLLAEVELRRGAAYSRLNESSIAEASFTDALDQASKAGDAYLEFAALGNLGAERMFAYRYDEAILYFERILPLTRNSGYEDYTARTLHNLGVCYQGLGDQAKALRLLSEAEPLYEKSGNREGREGCLGDLGTVHAAMGDYPAAISCFRKAEALARQLGNRLYAAEWLNNLASASLEARDWSSAADYNRRALETLEKLDRQRWVTARINSGRIAEGEGQRSDAERIYLRVIDQARALAVPRALIEGHARLGSLYAKSGDWRKAEEHYRALADTIEKGRSALKRSEWKLAYQSSIIPFYADYIDLLMDRGREAQALEAAESCRARVLAEKLGLERLIQPSTLRSYQALARTENAVLLSYWLGPRRSFLWAVTPGKWEAFVLPPRNEIAGLVEAYSNLILNLEDTRGVAHPLGRRLYDLLVAPAAKLIPSGSNVILVPDGPLYGLNFETLLTAGEQPKYWIEDVNIALAPSFAVLLARGPKPAPKSLLLIGDPVSPAGEFPALPDAETEIQSIRSDFPARRSKVITGSDAYPRAYQESGPGRFALIHFSAHAVASPENPLDSAVVLSRKNGFYKLYARDVAAVPLRAELVTVSACRSAGARLYSGEGLVGFSWAFLQAGARNVIAGLWDVNDRSTALLMSRLYRGISQGTPPAAALREAKLAFLAEPTYRRPYHWAPFELFTRSAPFRSR